jgi:phosphoglycolate phosphatase-like HAD superfamily hydrolase
MNKLLLFDIDGTLISGRGIPKKVVLEVFRKRFPHFEKGDDIAFNGMTDPLIVKELLAINNHFISMDDALINEILDEFIVELRHYVNPQSPPLLLPGVTGLLQACQAHDALFTGLVTGNVARGAQIKLSAVRIDHYFKVGAYGSDHWNRNRLPPIAIERSIEYFSVDFHTQDVWIIGDSLKDVECAKVNNLNCLAVETGKVEAGALRTAGADRVLKDLSDTQQILDIILNS